MPDASPFWQNAFLVGMFVAVGWCVWNGWRMGVVRAAVSMAGLFVAGLIGIAVGAAVGAILGAASPLYGGAAGMAAGVLVGLLAYGVIAFLSALLFKRTAQQRTQLLRLVYGAGGALIGAFVGVSVLWGGLMFVRSLGGFCEASVAAPAEVYRLPMPEPAAQALVKMKKSIEAGETGKLLASIDITPPEFYRVFDRLGKLVASPEAMRRFITYPEIQNVISDPGFIRLVRDPEIQDLARSSRTSDLLRNPKMHAAAADPGLIEKLQKIDIEKALDYALGASEPGAAPTPTPSQTP